MTPSRPSAKKPLSQARGVENGPRSILKSPKVATEERAHGVALDVRGAAITEQGTWGAGARPVVQFNAPAGHTQRPF